MVGIASEGSQHGLRTRRQWDPRGEVQVPVAGWRTEGVVWQQGWRGTREQRVPARWMTAWRGGSSKATVVAGPTAPGASWVLMGGRHWKARSDSPAPSQREKGQIMSSAPRVEGHWPQQGHQQDRGGWGHRCPV